MSLATLFLLFMKVGISTIGGGLVSIPLIKQEIVERGLITLTDFYNMVAISESTPGAIGLNISTYVGFNQFGLFGAIATTLGISIPSYIVVTTFSRFIDKFKNSVVLENAKTGIRATAFGLVATATYSVINLAVFSNQLFTVTNDVLQVIDWKALALFVTLLGLWMRFKWNVIFYILIGGIAGIFIF